MHRDLKPANVKFTATGAVKVLDFGIAKVVDAGVAAVAQGPTVAATTIGAIVGTAAYMSPEQARGQTVDARADIWAFGAVLYEMLSGRRAFDGATVSDVIAAVLTRDPDWSAVPRDVPPAVVRLLHRCLERDPARRLRHIGAARYVLADNLMPRAVASQPPRSWMRWLILPTAFAAGGALTFIAMRLTTQAPASPPAAVPPAILGMSEPPGETLYLFAGPLALSPDGTRLAIVTNSGDGKPHLWLRSLANMSPELLRGADGGMFPFWSPDGRSLGFFADGQVRIADLGSGAVRVIAPWKGPNGGAAWSPNGTIVFGDGRGFNRVSAAGGAITHLTTAASGTGEYHVAPCFLPDGRHFLYYVGSVRPAPGSIMVASIDGGEPRQVMASPSMAVYAPPGFLIYQRAGEIVAQAFDADSLQVKDEPVRLAAGVWSWAFGGIADLTASKSGVLMFAARRSHLSRLTTFDRSGRPIGTVGDPGEWIHVAVSPDERSVAAEALDPRTGSGGIWRIDLERNVSSLLTPNSGWGIGPIWSPDGGSLMYGASVQDGADLYVKAADGAGQAKPFYVSTELKVPTDWTRDGRIIFNITDASGTDIMTASIAGGAPTPLVKTNANEACGKLSPDGKWLAYESNETGRSEVYVRGIDGRGHWPVSRNGGGQPRWRRDGNELFYVGADSTLMAARVTAGAAGFSIAEPERLAISVPPDPTNWRYSYDVLSLGQRVITTVSAGADATPPIVVIPYWLSLVRR